MANSGKLPQIEGQTPEATALVERCRTGEKEALGEFYRTYRHDVARNLHRMLGPGRGDLDDVLQEVFIEVFRSIARFRGDAKISTWLYRVCVNVALQRLRKRRRLAEVQTADGPDPRDEGTPQRTLEARERMTAVYRILDGLAPKKRVVFVLHEIEGREPKEIAGIVGAPVLTVRTRLHYARKEFFARAKHEQAFSGEAAR
jgi:RNA polymerase sigma-70 factor, ECF subfamily